MSDFLLIFLNNGISMLILSYFCENYLEKKSGKNIFYVTLLITTLVVATIHYSFPNPNINLISSLFTMILFIIINYNIQPVSLFIVLMFTLALPVIIETVLYFATDLIFHDPYKYYYIPAYLSKLIYLLAIIYIVKSGSIKSLKKSNKTFGMLFLFTILTVAYALISGYFFVSSGMSLLFLINMIIVVISYIFLYRYMYLLTTNQKIQYEKELLEINEKSKKAYYELIEDQNKKVRKIKHDLKNRLTSIIASEGYQKDVLLKEIIGELEVSGLIPYTRNKTINYLLNKKIEKVEIKKENLEVFCDIPEELPINMDDITVIIGNLLDNAVEAVQKLKLNERYLKIEIKKDLYFLFIRIENSYTGITDLETQKENPEEHGYGIKSVRKLVQDYDGHMEIEQGNTFIVKITLPIFIAA